MKALRRKPQGLSHSSTEMNRHEATPPVINYALFAETVASSGSPVVLSEIMNTQTKSRNAMRVVLAFLFSHWKRERWLVAGVALAMTIATIADLFMPVFAGRLWMRLQSTTGHAARRCSQR